MPRNKAPEPGEGLFDALSSLPQPTNYTDQDRYRDFRKVFTGSDEGKRVLREILSWAHMFHSSAAGNPIDPYRTMLYEGERRLALRLLTTVHVEPPRKPTQAKRKP